MQFENLQALNKMKNLWYDSDRRLLVNGFYISIRGRPAKTEIYESFIPPLLRFFPHSQHQPIWMDTHAVQ